jgi:hypothetical protein
MAMLAETLAAHPLTHGQRVLALTFMHGARRRLSDRLKGVAGLAGRIQCCTVDAFAWRIYRRWRGLAAALGVPATIEGEFDAVCDAAGLLLEQPDVRSWTAMSFPIVLVDEGQDLRPQRLRMLVAVSEATHALLAADEFQYLDQALRPNPLVAWLQNASVPETLVQVRRTNVGGLLAAATAVRSSQAPANGQGFRLLPGAIGGRRTVGGFLHGGCNHRSGHTWDAALEKQLRPLAPHFGVKRQRGRTLRMEVITTAGENLLLNAGGQLEMARPEIKRTPIPDGETIAVKVGSIAQARGRAGRGEA